MIRQLKSLNGLQVLLWLAQLILASSLLWAAATKFFQPANALAAMWPWTADHRTLVYLTALLDLLAVIGLILPTLSRPHPRLTISSAYGIIGRMVAAIILHVSRGEISLIGIN